MPDCGSGGRWFEPTQLYQINQSVRLNQYLPRGAILLRFCSALAEKILVDQELGVELGMCNASARPHKCLEVALDTPAIMTAVRTSVANSTLGPRS